MLTLHIVLLIGAIVAAGVCLALYGGHPQRSIWQVLVASLPTWLIGVLSSLVLSASRPAIEWALPLICILILGIGCKSDRVFRHATVGLTVVAFLLCVNFFTLASNGYSGVDHTRLAASLLKHSLTAEADKLREEHAPDEVLPAQKLFAQMQHRYIKEWHTPVTRLYRVEKQSVAVWYPGGPVAVGADKLETRIE
jgi:hypothetical protein